MKYNWAVIGCGHIAGEMAEAMKKNGGCFYAVASRRYEKAKEFAAKYSVNRVYETPDEMLLDENIDIIYIATPHNTHIEYLKKALRANKHVLCEKAITLNSSELREAVTLAKENNLILAEAMTIYHCRVYDEVQKIISSGRLGKLKTIEVNLGSHKEYDMTNRFFNMFLAGGAMLDIGVYALSFMRYFMSEKPSQVLSQMNKAPTGADEQVNMLLKNSFGEMATINLSLVSRLPKLALAGFENGYVSFENYNRTNKAEVVFSDGSPSVSILLPEDTDALRNEITDMENAVSGIPGGNMHLDFTLDVMDIMTAVRYEHKMLYPEEM